MPKLIHIQAFEAARTSSLSERWTFDEGSGTTATGYWLGRPLTHNADYVAGVGGVGYALDFNGSSDYAYRSTGVSYADMGTGSFSVACWLKMDSASPTLYGIIGKGDVYPGGVGDGGGWGVYISGTQWVVSIKYEASQDVVNGAHGISAGTWTHCVWSFDRSPALGKTCRYYRDGVLINSDTTSVNVNVDAYGDFEIGRITRNTALEYYSGLMDDVWLYKGEAITQERVTALYKCLA